MIGKAVEAQQEVLGSKWRCLSANWLPLLS